MSDYCELVYLRIIVFNSAFDFNKYVIKLEALRNDLINNTLISNN